MGRNEGGARQAWPRGGAPATVPRFASGGKANSRFGDGRLAPASVTAEQPPDEWTHDPDRPVPFITEQSSGQIGGPGDYHGIENRGDVLVFPSAPLPEPPETTGPGKVSAHVDTSAPATRITAKLRDL